VNVGVAVIDPVVVAALVNGNDIVDLIDAVDADLAVRRSPAACTMSATTTASLPFTSAATITRDHVHGHESRQRSRHRS
jgi:hypothetical protein